MEYQFTGFTHSGEFREFAFDGVADDRSKTRFKVIADLALSRKYHIAVQELPLLCRRLRHQRNKIKKTKKYSLSSKSSRRIFYLALL